MTIPVTTESRLVTLTEGVTERPWHADGPLDSSDGENDELCSMWMDLIGGTGHSVAHMNLEARPNTQHLKNVVADARYVVRAANNFEELVRAAAKIVEQFPCYTLRTKIDCDCGVCLARAALEGALKP